MFLGDSVVMRPTYDDLVSELEGLAGAISRVIVDDAKANNLVGAFLRSKEVIEAAKLRPETPYLTPWE